MLFSISKRIMSTSGTSYLTRSSTSGTSYLTVSTVKNVYFSHSQRQNAYSNYWNTYISVIDYAEPLTVYGSSSRTNLLIVTISSLTRSRTIETWLYNQLRESATNTWTTAYSYFAMYPFDERSTWWARTIAGATTSFNTSNYTHRESYTRSDYDWSTSGGQYDTFVFSYNTSAKTTGTSYLTRSSTSATSYLTRSSTSRTEYKTRASTSGYSGVSSSSSQSSGWL